MLLNPVAEVLHFALRSLDSSSIEPGVEHFIQVVPVHHLLILRADFQYATAKGRFHEWRYSIVHEFLRSELQVCLSGLDSRTRKPLRPIELCVGVASVQKIVRDVRNGFAVCQLTKRSWLGWSESAVQTGKAPRQCGESIFIRASLSHVFKQL